MALDPGSFICKITSDAELVCSQVQAAQGPVAAFLHNWQDLIGTCVGALIGIVGALIVSLSSVRRRRVLAVLLLLPELKSIISLGERVKLDLQESGNLGVIRLKIAAIKHRRPYYERLHSAEAQQILDVDYRLWGHLTHCQFMDKKLTIELEKYDEIEPEAERTQQAFVRDSSAKIPYTPLHITRAFRDGAASRLRERTASVEQTFDLCVEHATLANYFVQKFVGASWYQTQIICAMRGDIAAGDYVVLPPVLGTIGAASSSQFNAIGGPSGAGAGGGENAGGPYGQLKNSSAFTGTMLVTTVRCLGSSRQEGGESWICTLDCLSSPDIGQPTKNAVSALAVLASPNASYGYSTPN